MPPPNRYIAKTAASWKLKLTKTQKLIDAIERAIASKRNKVQLCCNFAGCNNLESMLINNNYYHKITLHRAVLSSYIIARNCIVYRCTINFNFALIFN